MTKPRQRDLVAIGGSAGGVEALIRLVTALPADLPATVLVGLHLSHEVRSLLPDLLARRTPLQVLPAQDGLELLPGRIVVTVPDRHLLVVDDRIALGHGARENGHRPSHDAILRSVALLRGAKSIGVILTGLLDDGAAGLRCVERYGGSCLVQEPEDSAFPDMPLSALRAAQSARRVPQEDLAQEVVRLVTSEPDDDPHVGEHQRELDLAELASALGENTRLPDGSVVGEPSSFACPSCHGVLHHVPDDVLRFRCRTGHAWSAESLIAQQDRGVEEALWSALRALEERADMAARMVRRSEAGSRPWSVAHYATRRDEAVRSAETLRLLLEATTARSVPDPPGA